MSRCCFVVKGRVRAKNVGEGQRGDIPRGSVNQEAKPNVTIPTLPAMLTCSPAVQLGPDSPGIVWEWLATGTKVDPLADTETIPIRRHWRLWGGKSRRWFHFRRKVAQSRQGDQPTLRVDSDLIWSGCDGERGGGNWALLLFHPIPSSWPKDRRFPSLRLLSWNSITRETESSSHIKPQMPVIFLWSAGIFQ